MKKVALAGILILLVATFAAAQSSAVSTITVNAAATPLAAINSDGGVDDVLRATTYTVVYDAYAATSTVSPNGNGETPNGDVGLDITGDANTNIVVEMDLPDVLEGVGGTSMAIEFPTSGPGSGVRAETGGFFNPNVQNTFNFGNGGIISLRLGYVFTVPGEVTIAGEIYVGQILSNAYYTGL
ncbi:MAG: hypothetical protein EPO24_11620 [Bacteroidetes bacterium]|nr:MAG: hypothetical protein EPO24_11620 [Bacteroidota bacterium]